MEQFQYFRIYREHCRSLRRLNNERLGQLVRAFMDFAEMGREPQELDEAQMIIMDMLEDRLERDQAEYKQICERNRVNGAKRYSRRGEENAPQCSADGNADDTEPEPSAAAASGGQQSEAPVSGRQQSEAPGSGRQQSAAVGSGRTQSQPTQPNQTQPNQTQPNQTEPNPTEPNRAQPTTRTTRETDAGRSSSSSSSSTNGQLSPSEKECVDFARDAGFAVDNPATLAVIRRLFAEFGAEVMNRGIEACVEHNKTAPAYLKSTLINIRDNVPKPEQSARTVTVRRPGPFNDYDQRDSCFAPGLTGGMAEALRSLQAAQGRDQRPDALN